MAKKEKRSLIRTIYLYFFTLIGLVLVVMGGVRFVDMGLKAFVFTEADQERRLNYERPPLAPQPIEKIKQFKAGTLKLTQNQKSEIENWLADYQAWKEKRENADPITSRRHEEAAKNLAFILIGAPLYLYHWRKIKSEA